VNVERASLPGVDPDGFVAADSLTVLARRSPGEFTVAYPVPALVIEGTVAGHANAKQAVLERERSFARTAQGELDEPRDPAELARYVGRVAFLTKRPGNLFPDMITVGRVFNADITVVVGSVSKVHGYFREEAGVWSYTDQRATNGTFVNTKRLAEGERVVLRDGDRLQLGSDVVCTFLGPAALAQRFATPTA
jgi:hypothetical protein